MEDGARLSTHKSVDDKKRIPSSLIADILDGVGKRKVFTKLDLRWGYNNVRIKEGEIGRASCRERVYHPV